MRDKKKKKSWRIKLLNGKYLILLHRNNIENRKRDVFEINDFEFMYSHMCISLIRNILQRSK